jgi:ubiquinone/menaquinone biosynthesis C-methylase UbiE
MALPPSRRVSGVDVTRVVIAVLVATATLAPGLTAQQDAARDAWQRVPDVFAALAIGEGSRVADVGAGRGYFTARLADRVGRAGRVYAVDVDESSLSRLRSLVETDSLLNVEVIHGAADDPRLPPGELDAVLVVDTYHEMTEHAAMLAGMLRALKPGARLVLLDFRPPDPSASRSGQTARHTIAMEIAERELADAGFAILRREADFAEAGGYRRSRQWMLVAQRPLAAGARSSQ